MAPLRTAREACDAIVAMIEDRRASHERVHAHFMEKARQLVVSGDSAGARAWVDDGDRLLRYIREDEKLLHRIKDMIDARVAPAESGEV